MAVPGPFLDSNTELYTVIAGRALEAKDLFSKLCILFSAGFLLLACHTLITNHSGASPCPEFTNLQLF